MFIYTQEQVVNAKKRLKKFQALLLFVDSRELSASVDGNRSASARRRIIGVAGVGSIQRNGSPATTTTSASAAATGDRRCKQGKDN